MIFHFINQNEIYENHLKKEKEIKTLKDIIMLNKIVIVK